MWIVVTCSSTLYFLTSLKRTMTCSFSQAIRPSCYFGSFPSCIDFLRCNKISPIMSLIHLKNAKQYLFYWTLSTKVRLKLSFVVSSAGSLFSNLLNLPRFSKFVVSYLDGLLRRQVCSSFPSLKCNHIDLTRHLGHWHIHDN